MNDRKTGKVWGPDEGCDIDGFGDDDGWHALPIWCSTAGCDDSRCHRCFPRLDCVTHRKCVATS